VTQYSRVLSRCLGVSVSPVGAHRGKAAGVGVGDRMSDSVIGLPNPFLWNWPPALRPTGWGLMVARVAEVG